MENRDAPNPGREADLSKAQNQQQPTGQAQQQQPTDQAQQAEFGQAQQQQPKASQSQQSEYGQSQQQPSSNADFAVGQSDTVTEQRADIEGGTATGQASDVEGSSFVGSKGAADASSELIEDEEKSDFSRDGQGASE
jgi:hypothetical protein